ncbi:MAG: AI-2E family transporter [Oligoflexia bacterium]|nr:AI-2E family transporter [Oligoflexia bacterium]
MRDTILRRLFALLVTGFFFYVASPLLLPVLMGGLFAVLVMPALERLEVRGLRARFGAAILTLGMTLLFIIPTALLLYMVIKTGLQQLQAFKDLPKPAHLDWAHSWVESPFARRVLDWLKDLYPISSEELAEGAQDLVRSTSLRAADLLGGFLLNLPGIVMAMIVMIVSQYFFLVDGRRLVSFLRRNSFFSRHQTEELIERIGNSSRSVILASVISGVAQAFFFTVLCAAARVPNVPLVGALVFFSSFIPVVGTSPVTFGVAIHQALTGNSVAAVAAVIGAIVVSTMDNFIRPWFLRGSVNLHPMLAFVAAFGGLQTLGFVGVFLGPILAALFVAILEILSEPERPAAPAAAPAVGDAGSSGGSGKPA